MVPKLSSPLILASASPRRRELLVQAGYAFEVVEPPFEEPAPPTNQASAAAGWAEALAYYKAAAVAQCYTDAIVIGADTVVVYGDELIGKPKDESDARRILSTMFAGHNDVITGLAVLTPKLNKRIITHEVTSLVMRAMTNQELEDYIASGTWQGKAGAYALQEGGDKFLLSKEGSESNVVGLPMEKLEEILARIENEK
jgi:septum formation protein